MALKVLIVPDKFKGTLTSRQAAKAIAIGWKRARPRDRLELLPMSDGGDGFGEALGRLWHAKEMNVKTVDAAHRQQNARWWWDSSRNTAIIESAAVIGLAQLPSGRFHPFDLDTFGLGKVIRAASDQGAGNCIIGIGGSATNDAGFGLAKALGWQFMDAQGRELKRWVELDTLTRVSRPKDQPSFQNIIVAVDVQNPLLGRNGATRIYGPQKGLQPGDLAYAEACLRKLARVVQPDLKDVPGTGAAGGLGFGLAAFLGARIEPGFELFSRQANLMRKLHLADLVITGEGRLDKSTLMGKGVGQVAVSCSQLGIYCIGLAGQLAPDQSLKIFSQLAGMTQLASAKAAKTRPAYWLGKLAEMVAETLQGS